MLKSKMPRLSKDDRERAIGMLYAGSPAQVIAARLNVHPSTIHRLRNRYLATGSTADAPRSGRPRALTARTQRQVVRLFRNDPFQSASTIARRNNTSPSTIIRLLRRHHLFCRRPYRGARLSAQHRLHRQNWANQHANWAAEWNQVLFSDECRVCVDKIDNNDRVWRPRGQRFNARYIKEHNFWGGPSVMMWGGLYGQQLVGPIFFQLQRGRGGGVTAARYINQVLQPVVVPFFRRNQAHEFQHDNARPHAAQATQQFLRRNQIPTMVWPALSPDLNPMEQVWAYLKRSINKLPRRPGNAVELQQEIVRQWNRIPPAFLQRLVDSMPNRCRLVINNAGCHTRF